MLPLCPDPFSYLGTMCAPPQALSSFVMRGKGPELLKHSVLCCADLTTVLLFARLEVHLVGGFSDERQLSQKLTHQLLSKFTFFLLQI
jgi:hypothetical protein